MTDICRGLGVLIGSVFCGLLFVVVVSVGYSLAKSQPPTPVPAISAQQKKNLAANKADHSKPNDEPPKTSAAALNEPNSAEPDRPNSTEGGNQEPESLIERASITDWLMVAFNGVLTLFTLFQVVYLRAEMKATRDAADAATSTVEHMRLEQRAWLSIPGPPAIDEITSGKTMTCTTRLKNIGGTPAVLERQITSAFIHAVGDDIEPQVAKARARLVDEPIAGRVIPPDSQITMTSDHFSTTAEPGSLQGMRDGTKELIFLAIAEYRDIFGKPHTSQVCLIFNAKSKHWENHPKYNQMD